MQRLELYGILGDGHFGKLEEIDLDGERDEMELNKEEIEEKMKRRRIE